MTIDPDLLRRIEEVKATRPRRVLLHILKHGHVTTAELQSAYGYNHPPRAARDVREQGIPLKTFRVKGPDGRSIGAYKLDDSRVATEGRRGRRAFSKAFKAQLVAQQGEICALCGWHFPASALQIDHRVPYEVAGDGPLADGSDSYMLVCGACNRSKSWSCEHCSNWLEDKDASVCRTCMWGSPEGYLHIATEERRSLTVTWQGKSVERFAKLQRAASKAGMTTADYARQTLDKVV